MTLDTSLFLKINHIAEKTPSLHGFFNLYANSLGIGTFAFLLVLGYILARRKSDVKAVIKAIWAGGATIIAVGLNQPLVHLFGEKRPFVVLHNILVLTNHASDFSFPSDHGVMAGAVIAGLFLYNKVLGYISLVLGLLLAFGRVYIAAHWPQDVVAGLIFGAAVTLIGYAVLKKPLNAVADWIVKSTPLRIFITSKVEGVAKAK